MSGKKHTICTECEMHHYDNCHTCWGFGVYSHGDQTQPVSAGEAHARWFFGDVIPCPECGSTEKGLPTNDPHTLAIQ